MNGGGNHGINQLWDRERRPRVGITNDSRVFSHMGIFVTISLISCRKKYRMLKNEVEFDTQE